VKLLVLGANEGSKRGVDFNAMNDEMRWMGTTSALLLRFYSSTSVRTVRIISLLIQVIRSNERTLSIELSVFKAVELFVFGLAFQGMDLGSNVGHGAALAED
jgi:hypothetical protein